MEAAADRPGRSGVWALSLGVALVLAAGFFEVHNLDWPLHDVTGRWILEHRTVPGTNVLSELHHDYPSVHDKWGFQVLLHELVEAAGPEGLIVLRLLLLLALFGTLAATARGLGARPAATLVCLTLALVAARSRFLMRPDLVSLVLLAWFVHVALVLRPDGRRAAWLLIPAQLVWVNLHGYFVLGWMVAAVVAAARWMEGQRARPAARRWCLLAVGLALTCLANPAGLAGWWHPFAVLRDLSAHAEFYRSSIEEFLPTFAQDPRQPFDRVACLLLGALALLSVLPRGVAALLGSQRRVLDAAWPALALMLLFAFMLPSLRRNMATFAIVVAAPTAAALPRGLARSRGLALGAALLAVLAAAGEVTDATSIHDGLQRRWGWGVSRLAYPDLGIAFIARELPHARVFTAFRYGSTFTGRRWPEQVASTNGNTHGYPTEWLERVMAATADTDPMAFRLLALAHDFDAALIPMACPLAGRLLRDPDWTLVCLGLHEAVFVERASVPVDWLATHDLEAVLARGETPYLPEPEARPSWAVERPAGAPFTAALLAAAGGHGEAAVALARQAVADAPGDGAALGLLGLMLAQRGELDEALGLFERSVGSGTSHPMAEEVRRQLERLRAAGE